jgi:hypothetical protein
MCRSRRITSFGGDSGGLEHPHDTPPYPFMPSPTFTHSSTLSYRSLMLVPPPRPIGHVGPWGHRSRPSDFSIGRDCARPHHRSPSRQDYAASRAARGQWWQACPQSLMPLGLLVLCLRLTKNLARSFLVPRLFRRSLWCLGIRQAAIDHHTPLQLDHARFRRGRRTSCSGVSASRHRGRV